MSDTWEDIKDLVDAEVEDLLDDLDSEVQPDVQKALRNIAFLTAQLVAAPAAKKAHLKLGIDAELSRLASIASIEVSEAQTRAKQVTAKVIWLVIDKALG